MKAKQDKQQPDAIESALNEALESVLIISAENQNNDKSTNNEDTESFTK